MKVSKFYRGIAILMVVIIMIATCGSYRQVQANTEADSQVTNDLTQWFPQNETLYALNEQNELVAQTGDGVIATLFGQDNLIQDMKFRMDFVAPGGEEELLFNFRAPNVTNGIQLGISESQMYIANGGFNIQVVAAQSNGNYVLNAGFNTIEIELKAGDVTIALNGLEYRLQGAIEINGFFSLQAMKGYIIRVRNVFAQITDANTLVEGAPYTYSAFQPTAIEPIEPIDPNEPIEPIEPIEPPVEDPKENTPLPVEALDEVTDAMNVFPQFGEWKIVKGAGSLKLNSYNTANTLPESITASLGANDISKITELYASFDILVPDGTDTSGRRTGFYFFSKMAFCGEPRVDVLFNNANVAIINSASGDGQVQLFALPQGINPHEFINVKLLVKNGNFKLWVNNQLVGELNGIIPRTDNNFFGFNSDNYYGEFKNIQAYTNGTNQLHQALIVKSDNVPVLAPDHIEGTQNPVEQPKPIEPTIPQEPTKPEVTVKPELTSFEYKQEQADKVKDIPSSIPFWKQIGEWKVVKDSNILKCNGVDLTNVESSSIATALGKEAAGEMKNLYVSFDMRVPDGLDPTSRRAGVYLHSATGHGGGTRIDVLFNHMQLVVMDGMNVNTQSDWRPNSKNMFGESGFVLVPMPEGIKAHEFVNVKILVKDELFVVWVNGTQLLRKENMLVNPENNYFGFKADRYYGEYKNVQAYVDDSNVLFRKFIETSQQVPIMKPDHLGEEVVPVIPEETEEEVKVEEKEETKEETKEVKEELDKSDTTARGTVLADIPVEDKKCPEFEDPFEEEDKVKEEDEVEEVQAATVMPEVIEKGSTMRWIVLGGVIILGLLALGITFLLNAKKVKKSKE